MNDCEKKEYGKNQYKKKEHNQQFSAQSITITLISFRYHRSIDNSTGFIFLSCCEKASDNKGYSSENSKPRGESRITIH